jgi:hypothetical protein
MKLVYIASPYTHESITVMQERYELVRDFTSKCMQNIENSECVPFSPIVHNHDIAQTSDLPRTYEFWMVIDKTMIRHCDELWVLMIDGWEKSAGIKMEIAFAQDSHIPVVYCTGE